MGTNWSQRIKPLQENTAFLRENQKLPQGSTVQMPTGLSMLLDFPGVSWILTPSPGNLLDWQISWISPGFGIKLPKFTRTQEITSTMLKMFWGRTPRPPALGVGAMHATDIHLSNDLEISYFHYFLNYFMECLFDFFHEIIEPIIAFCI